MASLMISPSEAPVGLPLTPGLFEANLHQLTWKLVEIVSKSDAIVEFAWRETAASLRKRSRPIPVRRRSEPLDHEFDEGMYFRGCPSIRKIQRVNTALLTRRGGLTPDFCLPFG